MMVLKALLLAGLLSTHDQTSELSASQQTDKTLDALSPTGRQNGLRLTSAQADAVLALTDVLRHKASNRLKGVTPENETAVYAQIRADWVIAINNFLKKQNALSDDIRMAMVADSLHWARIKSDKRSSAEMLRFSYRFSFEPAYSGKGQDLKVQ